MPRKPKNDPKAGLVTKQIVEKVKLEEAKKAGRPPREDEVLREQIREHARNIVQKIEDVTDVTKLANCRIDIINAEGCL